MRCDRTRVLATSALSLAILAACSSPAMPSRATPTGAPPTVAPTPAALRSTTPIETALATAGPPTSCDAIDPTTLTGRIVFDDGEDVWAVNADGTGLTRLTDEPWREFQPALSPDRRLIAYRAEPADYPELWIMAADGSGKRRLTPEGGFPAWSPDGSTIAYAPPGGPSGRSSIAIINPDGSGIRELPGTELGEYPAWSPDGKRLAFSSAGSGERVMSIVDVDGSGVVDLSSAGEGSHPAWSPDGALIVFASHRDHADNYRDLYAMAPDGSEVRRLTYAAAETPAWSPDGRYILYSAPGGLSVMQPDGCGVTRLAVEGVAWASKPDWR